MLSFFNTQKVLRNFPLTDCQRLAEKKETHTKKHFYSIRFLHIRKRLHRLQYKTLKPP